MAAQNAGAKLAQHDTQILRKLGERLPVAQRMLSMVWTGAAVAGGFVESLPKIATFKKLSEQGVKPQRAVDLATLSGIPMPGISPKYARVAELLTMFWRVYVAGHRAMAIRQLPPKHGAAISHPLRAYVPQSGCHVHMDERRVRQGRVKLLGKKDERVRWTSRRW